MREEKKAEKRQGLVGVCLDCFVEKGLTVATTKDLCKAAKLQNGGIYYYFSTKEEIVLACAEEAINRIEKGLPTVSIGIYLRVLYALQLDDDILLLAKEDVLGRTLQDLSLKHRKRASKKG